MRSDVLAPTVDVARITGIHSRYLCGPGQDSLTLANDAADLALAAWGGDPATLDLVVVCSITRAATGSASRFQPTLSSDVARRIGAHGALTFDLSNACTGTMTAMAMAADLIAAGRARRVLVVSGETNGSLATNAADGLSGLGDPQFASLTLGDAGAAVVLEQSQTPGLRAWTMTAEPSHADLCTGHPCPSGPGGQMVTDSMALHRAATRAFPPVLGQVLDDAGWDLAGVVAIPHQTSSTAIRQGLARARRALGAQPPRLLIDNLRDHGNTTTTTQLLAWAQGLRDGTIAPTDRVLLAGFGSGVVVGAMAIEQDGVPVGAA